MSKQKNKKTESKNTETDEVLNDASLVPEEASNSDSNSAKGAVSASSKDETSSENDVSAELLTAQEEIVKLKDAYLRAKAEEDNVRRRSEKEVANSRKFAVEGFAKEMLNVLDSLKLACSVEIGQDKEATVKSLHEGVEITLKQLSSAFAKFALTEIEPEVGDKLDPSLHQAMSLLDSEDIDSGCVINVIQSGFTLHDRLLRPAMVVVAK